MDFRHYLNKNRISRKRITPERTETVHESVVDEIKTPLPVCEEINEIVEVVETVEKVVQEKHDPISPSSLINSLRQETYIQKEIKKNNKRYIGEVAELPSTVEFEEGTLVRKGQTVYIKQDGLWESLFEGNTVTREVVKYGVPGGGCGVDEVKRIVKSDSIPDVGPTAPTVYQGPAVSVAGVLWYWSEYGVYAKAGSPPYVGSTIPTATMARKGDLIQVDNLAVPLGRSILRCTGTTWAPPAGEPIAMTAKTSSSPLALVTPGVTSLVQIWAGPVIPDYMIPDLLEMETDANIGTQNTVTQANAGMVGVVISGQLPVDQTYNGYMVSYPLTPGSSFYKGVGAGSLRSRISMRSGGTFVASDTYYNDGSSSITQKITGVFVSGEVRMYAMAKPGHVSDQVRFDRAAIYSKGNL